MSKQLPALAMESLAPGQNLESYIQVVNSFNILTAEEEKTLAERLYYHEDLQAARQLVLSHMRFVVHIARSYSGYGLSQADLIQEGNVGLMKAIKRFNPEVGVRLVSFAVHWIKAEIHEYILKNWRIVKVATTKAQRKLFFNLRSSKKRLGWLSDAEAQDIATDLGVKKTTVYEMEGRMSSRDMTFDLDSDDDEVAAFSPSQMIEDYSYDPARLVEADNYETDANDQLMSAVNNLDERSQDIIRLRWLSDGKSTLHDLANKYGVSAERIRQLEKNAMKKVRGALESAGVEI